MIQTPSQKPNGTWLFFVSAGLILLNFPFIQVFNNGGTFFGVPTLLVYIFFVWALLLSGLIIFSRILCWKAARNEKEQEKREDQQ